MKTEIEYTTLGGFTAKEFEKDAQHAESYDPVLADVLRHMAQNERIRYQQPARVTTTSDPKAS
ncbi:MAG: hypothetical protein ABSG84_12305 [Acidobacteriaceae bacterium]|jgi:hypothetical protein